MESLISLLFLAAKPPLKKGNKKMTRIVNKVFFIEITYDVKNKTEIR